MKRFVASIVCLFLLCAFSSCRSKQEEGVLRKSKMSKVLYDYHLAQAMAEQVGSSDSTAYFKHLYVEAVFRKHGISEKEFLHSLRWYTRHTEDLYEIYQGLDKRYTEASLSMDGGQVSINPLNVMGDTVHLWQGPSHQLLCSSGINRFTFELLADTSYHSGDCLQWEFSTRWIYGEGTKSATAVMSVCYDNDSVATSIQYVYSSGKQSVVQKLGKRKPKSITCFVYQNAPWSASPKLLMLSDISLVRFRNKERASAMPSNAVQDSANAKVDSLDVARKRVDSIIRSNNGEGRPHFREDENAKGDSLRPVRAITAPKRTLRNAHRHP